ncbi:LRR domain containing protein, partial [Trema orientale]
DKCINLERLPEGIGRLVNLRHLYIDYCWKLRGLPKGIGKLAGLQKLDMLVIPQNKEAYFHFGDLKTWNHHQLQGFLRIKRCENFENVGEAEKTSLIKMKDLQDLCLQFDLRDADPQHEVEILEALKPHENLKVLSIEYYMGTIYASWMTSLINLRYLTLGACSNCEILPPLGKLPCLESLQICLMKSVKKIGAEFLGLTEIDHEEDRGSANITNDSFPKLKKLRFVHLTQLKEWQGNIVAQGGSTFMVMPCLHSLEISSCSSLEVLPDFLQMSPLQHLTIKRCKILQRCCQMGKGKEWHKISHVPSIKIVEEYVEKTA